MLQFLIRSATLGARAVPRLFSRFLGRGSRLAPSAAAPLSKFFNKTPTLLGGRLAWFWSGVKQVALFTAISAGFDWVFGDDGTTERKESETENATLNIKDIFLNDLVRMSLDTAGGDPESSAIILDNYAMMLLNTDDAVSTMEGLATAAAAEYIRRTRNGSPIYDLPDALVLVDQFTQLLEGKDAADVTELSDEELEDAVSSVEEVERDISLNPYSTTADLLAFQFKFILDMQKS